MSNNVKTGITFGWFARASRLVAAVVLGWAGVSSGAVRGEEPSPPAFERVVIDDKFPGAYQVEVADVNGDGKPDVIAVGGGTCAWYENPSWKKRIVTSPKESPGIISSATADLDGDGKAEVAIAYEFSMNVPTKGKLLLASQGKTLDDPWEVTPIADVGSIHRLRWGTVFDSENVMSNRTTRQALVVAPIFGPSAKPPGFGEEPAHLVLFYPSNPPRTGKWTRFPIGDAPVLHAIDVSRPSGDAVSQILSASNLGVTRFNFSVLFEGGVATPSYLSLQLASGASGEAPKKGASEIHQGKLKDGRAFLTTVEPWHGTEVAVYLGESDRTSRFGARNVIDNTIKEGHALWVADVDGDGDDEIFAGYRGPGTSVIAYDFDGKSWRRSIVDNAIAAQDLRGGDLNGDGTPDIVAVGGSTHNVVWYRPKRGR